MPSNTWPVSTLTFRAAQAAQHEQEVKGAEGEVEAAKEEHDRAAQALRHARMVSSWADRLTDLQFGFYKSLVWFCVPLPCV